MHLINNVWAPKFLLRCLNSVMWFHFPSAPTQFHPYEYRPIAPKSNFAKVFKKVLKTQVEKHLSDNKLLSSR